MVTPNARRWALAAGCIVVCAGRGVPAQGGRGLTVDDVLRLEELDDVVPSPDGKYIAIEVARPMSDGVRMHASLLDSRPRRDIWLVRLRDGAKQQVAHGTATGSGWFDPVWSPDGTRLAMLSTAGCACVRAWAWRLGDGAPHLVDQRNVDFWVFAGAAGLASDLQPLVWMNGTSLLLPLLPTGARSHVDLDAEAESVTIAGWRAQREGEMSTASVLESVPGELQPYLRDESIVIADVERHTSRVLATIPRDPTTSGRRSIIVSPDHRMIALLTSRLEGPRGDERLTRTMSWYALGLIDVIGRDTIRWVADLKGPGVTGEDMPVPSWTPNGGALVLRGKRRRDGRWESGLWRIDARTGSMAPAACPARVPQCSAQQAASGEGADGHQLPYRNDPCSGEALGTSPGDLPPGYRLDACVPQAHEWIVRRRDRVVAKLEAGQLQTLFEINAWSDSIAEPRKVFLRYRAADGDSLGAILLLPAARPAAPNGRYPLVVWVYAGFTYQDTTDVRDDRAWNSQYNLSLLTAKGYAVLYPSIPLAPQGSEGPVAPHLTGAVLPAIDRVGSLGVIDTSRVAVMGQSFGGWTTLALIARTERFRSAIAMAAVSDQISYRGAFRAWDRPWTFAHTVMAPEKMLEAGQQSLGGPFWQYPERYIDDSPVLQANRVNTPTMIIQGDRDFEGIQQAEEFFTALYRLGKRAELVRYFGDGHVIESRANIRDMWQRIFAWLSATLATSTDTSRAAPN